MENKKEEKITRIDSYKIWTVGPNANVVINYKGHVVRVGENSLQSFRPAHFFFWKEWIGAKQGKVEEEHFFDLK